MDDEENFWSSGTYDEMDIRGESFLSNNAAINPLIMEIAVGPDIQTDISFLLPQSLSLLCEELAEILCVKKHEALYHSQTFISDLVLVFPFLKPVIRIVMDKINAPKIVFPLSSRLMTFMGDEMKVLALSLKSNLRCIDSTNVKTAVLNLLKSDTSFIASSVSPYHDTSIYLRTFNENLREKIEFISRIMLDELVIRNIESDDHP